MTETNGQDRSLVNLLDEADENDLEQVRQEIRELERKLNSLKVLEKSLATKLGVEPLRAAPQQRRTNPRRAPQRRFPPQPGTPAADDDRPLREIIFDLIHKQGPGTPEQITHKLRAQGHTITVRSVTTSVGHSDWFYYDEEGRVIIQRTADQAKP